MCLFPYRLTHMFSFWQASYERNDLTQGFEEPWKTLPICFPCWTCGEFWKRNCLPVINYQQIPPEAEPFSFQESYSITQFNMSLMPVTQCTMYWFVSYVPTVIFHRHIGGFSWLLLCSQNSGVRNSHNGVFRSFPGRRDPKFNGCDEMQFNFLHPHNSFFTNHIK